MSDRVPPSTSSAARYVPAALLAATVVLYLATVGQTWIYFDHVHQWGTAASYLRRGEFPWRGTDIVGIGYNGPLLSWIYHACLAVVLSEWTVPVVCAGLAAIAALWASRQLWRRRPGTDALWPVLLVATSPVAFEWSRGGNYSWWPILWPAAMAVWARLQRPPLRLRWCFAAGLIFAVGTQLYVAFLPTAAAGGLVLLTLLEWRPWTARRLRQNGVRLGVYAAGFVLPYLPSLLGGLHDPQWIGYTGVGQALRTAGDMIAAYPRHLTIRASAVAPWLAPAVAAVAWLTVAAPLLALPWWRRLSPLQRVAWWTVVLIYVLTAYDDQRRYHHFFHVALAFPLSAALLWPLLARERRRLAVAAVVAVQLAFVTAVQVDAARTGFVTLATIFPARLPHESSLAPTLQVRTALFAELAARGIDDPWTRDWAVHGNRELPFWSDGWVRIDEYETFAPYETLRSMVRPVGTPPSTLPATPHLELHACEPDSPGHHVRPALCLREIAAPPPVVVQYAPLEGVPRQAPFALAAARPDAGLVETANHRQLRFDVRPYGQLRLRAMRGHGLVKAWRSPIWVLQPELPVLARYNAYGTQEALVAVPVGVTAVTLYTPEPGRLVVLDVEP